MDYHYGKRAATAVLYKGTSFKTASGTVYLNISDYLKAIYNNKDMNKAIQLLAKDLVVRDLKAEEHQNDSVQYDS
jgi:virulence-associated protein VapD